VLAAQGKLRGEALYDELRLREAAIPAGELLARCAFDFVVRLIVFEIAVAVALGDARLRERALGAITCGAIAGNRPHYFRFADGRTGLVSGKSLRAVCCALDNFPAAALADGTIRSRHLARICGLSSERKQTTACAKCGTCGRRLRQCGTSSSKIIAPVISRRFRGSELQLRHSLPKSRIGL